MEPSKQINIAVVILLIVLTGVVLYHYLTLKTPENGNESDKTSYLEATDCWIKAPNQPYYLTEDDLIACLIKHESGGNPNAIGDQGKAKGILQFHDSTFQMYCVDKYGYPDDIMNPTLQINCCAKMIVEGHAKHWTTLKFCQQ